MRRTRLNVLPPASKPALGNGLSGEAEADNDYAMMTLNGSSVPSMVTVAANVVEAPLSKESRTSRVKRLQEEAKQLAREQVTDFEAAMVAVARMAEEIADGGDAYHVGVREFCRRMAEEMPRNVTTLQAILKKV